MIKRTAALILIISATGLFNLRAQEVLRGLQSARDITDHYSQKSFLKSKGLNDTLELPFFDDFSFSNIYPHDSLWADDYVYINNTYAFEQLSMGVATFDALDNRGLLYDNASTLLFEADHLTSRPLNLEGSAADNFYLSFFYQPQGLIDAPSRDDSLTLQFWSVSDETWYSVWKAEGTEVHPFKPVIIHVDDDRFTSKGFRFRFINYATLAESQSDIAMSGNADFWHIDYVYLNRNRNQADTILHDVAFTSPLRSVLNNYEAIPWNQFREWYVSIMGPPVSMSYANNDNIVRNISRSFKINDLVEGTEVHAFPPLARNIDPGSREVYDAPLSYVFNSPGEDSALFEIKASLITDVFDNKQNDTISYMQVFKNYFAVDDGSSELGYGINGGGSNNAMAVYRYRSFSPDTLRAIQICFNDSYQNANQRLFDLVILSSDNQVPGDIIYEQEEALVDPGSEINGFTTYYLDDPVFVDGEFFAGWRQRSETWLNAGFDINTPHNGRQYYYLGGVWRESSKNGSLMIRPVVGKALVSTGIGLPDTGHNLIIWPNPASDILNIKAENTSLYNTVTEIYDLNGRIIYRKEFNEQVDVAGFAPGIYYLLLKDKGLVVARDKFIKNR